GGNMKKVGIITLNGYKNYGNRLQNYALQEVIKQQGFEVETILNSTKHNSVHSNGKMLNKLEVLRSKNVKEIYKVLHRKIQNRLYKNKLNHQRTKMFKDFTLTYITETDYSISEDNIPSDLLNKY